MERTGVARAEKLDLETLAARMRAEAVAFDATACSPAFVGALPGTTSASRSRRLPNDTAAVRAFHTTGSRLWANQLEADVTNLETIAGVDGPADARSAPVAPRVALAAAAVAAGLSAGVFYDYQVSVTRALAAVDDVTYVRTVQAINDKIENPWFFLTFLGTPPLIVAALLLNRRSARSVRNLIGAGLVLNLTLIAITAFGNIPLNDDLAKQEVVNPETAAVARSDYEQPWNRLNLARTLAAVGSVGALTVATIVRPRR